MRNIAIISLLIPITLTAGILADEELRPTIQETISMRFGHHYREADSILLELQTEYPDDPAPLFLRGSNLLDNMQHREDYRDAEQVYLLLDSAIAFAENDTSDPWHIWIIGSSLGYKAIIQAEMGKLILALKTSLGAMSYLERAHQHHETSADAALGMGGYYYWKSAKLRFLTYLPLMKDRRSEGMHFLREARDESIYSREAAMHSLVYIYCEEGMLDSARCMRDSIAANYPGSLLPLWYDLAISEASQDLEAYFLAASVLSTALDTCGEEQIINRLEAHLLAATAASELEDWASICQHYTAVLGYQLPSWVNDDSRNQISDFRELAATAAERGEPCQKIVE